jgi:lysophospholipase L1-like esterase
VSRHASHALALLLAALCCGRFATAAAPAAADAPAPIVRVMPLGDSITVGEGSSTGAGYRLPLWRRSTAQHRYTVQMVGSQQSGNFPQPWHEGHSGWMVDDLTQKIDGWLAAQQPDVVLLQIGINDLDRSTDKAHAGDRLAVLVDRIFADRPSVRLILQGVLPTTAGLEQLAQQYDRQAAALVPTERERGRDMTYAAPPQLTSAEFYNRLHPNDRGYARIADAFFQAMDGDLTNQPIDEDLTPDPLSGTVQGPTGDLPGADDPAQPAG